MTSADTIIDDLGGTGNVAAALSLSASTVSSWRERGIPAPRWLDIVRLGKERGIEITLETLAELAAAVPPAETAEASPT